MSSVRFTLLLLTAPLLLPAAAHARPPYVAELADYLGPHLSARLKTCATCHAGPDEKKLNAELSNPHNPFGARLMAAANELGRKGAGVDLAARLKAVADEDSDGDGAPNRQELITGHLPGSAADKPSAEEVAALKAPQRRPAAPGEYAWRPFRPLGRPAVPTTGAGAWIRNPVDAFIAAEHRRRGLKPRPEAKREILLRRVYFDLIGLPPTRDELKSFLADRRPDAYERVVDRLLAAPQYGERWARHWMDVWRYSDWDGYGAEVRKSHPHIWRWRDWIVDSLNQDRGYDQMVREMLAGDELAPGEGSTVAATGFLVRNWHRYSRDEMLTTTVESVGKAFLGLTMNCARCHDHKYDPISQQDYFAFQAYFQPMDVRIDRVPGQPDTKLDGISRIYDGRPQARTYLLQSGDVRKPDRSRVILPDVPGFLRLTEPPARARTLPRDVWAPAQQEWVRLEDLKLAEEAVTEARKMAGGLPADATSLQREMAEARVAAVEAALAALRADHEVEKLASAHGAANETCRDAGRLAMQARLESRLRSAMVTLVEARLRLETAKPEGRAKAENTLKEAEAAVEAARKAAAEPPAEYSPREQPLYPAASTGRRTALARWVTDPGNPLTARAAINQIWLRHFGQPLVPTVFDLGGNGRPPAMPALLDWLAAELMGLPGGSAPAAGSGRDGFWSMKRIHRLIVTSAAYRMDSGHDAEMARKDPDNRYHWRAIARRLEAEAVRDALLHAAGSLDFTRGGPELPQDQGEKSRRRSIYFRQSIEKVVPFLTVFDQASVTEAYTRPITVVPQQALALSNSSLAISQSRLLARRIWDLVKEKPADRAQRDFIDALFEQVLGRLPSQPEREACSAFVARQAALLAQPEALTAFRDGPKAEAPPSSDPWLRARENLAHVLFNHNDFVTVR